MIEIREITELHATTVQQWHQHQIDNQHKDFLEVVCRQHQQNFKLWHQEDIARSPDVSDSDLARVKRSIDKLNQQRNDLIEQLDDSIIHAVAPAGHQIPARRQAEHRNARQRNRSSLDPVA